MLPTHLDRNFAQELEVFKSYNDEHESGLAVGQLSSLIKHIVFYLANKYQTSPLTLFNSFVFDLDEFSKMTGYQKSLLMVEHPSPMQQRKLRLQGKAALEELKSKEQETGEILSFSSVIENALFRLATEPPVLRTAYNYVSSDGEKHSELQVEGVPVIKKLKINSVKSKNGKIKKIYSLELSEVMCNNFSRIFTQVDYKRVIAFRKQQLDDLYIFLKTVRLQLASKNISNTTDYSFNKLCDVAGLNFSQPAKNKATLTKKINLINELSEIKVRIEWLAANGDNRIKYLPNLIFDLTQPEVQVDRIKLLYDNFVKALFEKMPPVRQLKNNKGETPFLDDSTFDETLIQLLNTFPADKVVFAPMNMSFKGAVENAYSKAQAITFGTQSASTQEGVKVVYSMLTKVSSVAQIKEVLSKAYTPTAYYPGAGSIRPKK